MKKHLTLFSDKYDDERSIEGQKGRLAEDRVFDKRCPCIRGLEKRFLPNISFFSMI